MDGRSLEPRAARVGQIAQSQYFGRAAVALSDLADDRSDMLLSHPAVILLLVGETPL